MTSYVYEGGRLLYPALVVSWLIIYVLIHNGNVFKRGLLLFFIAFALVASGYYLPLSQMGSDKTPRLTSMRLNDKYITRILTMTDTNPITTYIDERITPAYLHIVSQPDASHYYYSEHGAIVIPYLLPFLFIGMGVALFYWRKLGLLLLLWVVITVAGNSLIWSNNWTPRFIVVFPGLMLLIAFGLDTMCQGSVRSLSKSLAYKVKLLSIIGLAGIGIFQMYFYFGILVPDFNLIGLVRADDFDAMWRAQELPATEVYVLPYDPLYHDYVAKIQSYERHHNLLKIFGAKDFDFLEFEPDLNKPYAFFVEDDDLDTRLGLRFIFGPELIGPEWSDDDRLPEEFQYILYKYIPSEQ